LKEKLLNYVLNIEKIKNSQKKFNLIIKNIMKTNKILATWIAATIILSLWANSIYAYGWNWEWKWNGKNLTQDQRERVKDMSQEERKNYMNSNWFKKESWKRQGWEKWQWKDHSTWNMINDIPSSDLTTKEIEILSYGYSEEMLARDAYNYFYELYGEDVFKKISESEQKHMDAVKTLLDRYNLDTPTWYWDLQSTFDSLKSEWELSLKNALEVGLKIEILDIDDIENAIKNTDNDDFKVVFINIGWASYNHMRAFVKAINNNNLNTNIDYSDFLSESELNIKWPLKYKLSERLESAWVYLPDRVSSNQMKNKRTDNKEISKRNNKFNKKSETNNLVNNTLKSEYKKTYENKYWEVISKMDDWKLNVLISKIDILIKNTNNWNYSYKIKEKYNAMLEALREIANDNLSINSDLNSLFN